MAAVKYECVQQGGGGGGHHRTQGSSYPRPEAVCVQSLPSSVDRQRVTRVSLGRDSCVRETDADIWCF